MSATEVIARLGGIAHVRDVLAGGVARSDISQALRRGQLVRPRRGVIALPSMPTAILRAAAAGGALAGPSAARLHGMWTPDRATTFVSVRRDAHTDRVPKTGVTFIRDAHHLSARESFLVTPVTSVRQCIRLLPFDHAVAVVDSAINGRGSPPVLSTAECRTLSSVLPRRLHRVLDAMDSRSESGAESIARVRLARIGILARPQVWITESTRVDLLIGDRLVVEIGSREFHANPEQYENDHARATTLLALGFDYLEFTTDQVMNDWETVESVIARRVLSQQSEPPHRTAAATHRAPNRIAG